MKAPYYHLELETTLHFLKQYLPKRALILDAGGGPGRYSIELAKLGYDVVLLDLTPALLELAKKKIKQAGVSKRIKQVIVGSITDLSHFPKEEFDAVVCLGGPLSHLPSERERKRAVSELVRVSKKGSLIFVSVIGKYGTLHRAPISWPSEIKFKEFVRTAIRGDDYRWHGSRFAHYFTIDELHELFSARNLKLVKMAGLQGISNPSSKAINALAKDRQAWRNWMKIHFALLSEPAIVDTSSHILVILRKK